MGQTRRGTDAWPLFKDSPSSSRTVLRTRTERECSQQAGGRDAKAAGTSAGNELGMKQFLLVPHWILGVPHLATLICQCSNDGEKPGESGASVKFSTPMMPPVVLRVLWVLGRLPNKNLPIFQLAGFF